MIATDEPAKQRTKQNSFNQIIESAATKNYVSLFVCMQKPNNIPTNLRLNSQRIRANYMNV